MNTKFLYPGIDLIRKLKSLPEDRKQKITQHIITDPQKITEKMFDIIPEYFPEYMLFNASHLIALNDTKITEDSYSGTVEGDFATWFASACDTYNTCIADKNIFGTIFLFEFCYRFLQAESKLVLPHYNPQKAIGREVFGTGPSNRKSRRKSKKVATFLIERSTLTKGSKSSKMKKKKGFAK
jgi:hypothetical protein